MITDVAEILISLGIRLKHNPNNLVLIAELQETLERLNKDLEGKAWE